MNEAPASSTAPSGWRELALLRHGVHAMTYLAWFYLLLNAGRMLYWLVPSLRDTGTHWIETGVDAFDVVMLGRFVLPNLVGYVAIGFMAWWLTVSARAMNACQDHDGWRNLPAALLPIRQVAFVLSLCLITKLLWYVHAWEKVQALRDYLAECFQPDPWTQ